MFKVDQFSAANEAAINQFAHFAQLSLANLEKFAEIGLDAARDSVEQATAHAAALAGAKDVHEVIAINSATALAARLGTDSIEWAVAIPFTIAAVGGVLVGRIEAELGSLASYAGRNAFPVPCGTVGA